MIISIVGAVEYWLIFTNNSRKKCGTYKYVNFFPLHIFIYHFVIAFAMYCILDPLTHIAK